MPASSSPGGTSYSTLASPRQAKCWRLPAPVSWETQVSFFIPLSVLTLAGILLCFLCCAFPSAQKTPHKNWHPLLKDVMRNEDQGISCNFNINSKWPYKVIDCANNTFPWLECCYFSPCIQPHYRKEDIYKMKMGMLWKFIQNMFIVSFNIIS